MSPFDREIRALVYVLFWEGARRVDARALAERSGRPKGSVADALTRLTAEHRLALTAEGDVWMAHPFSGVETGYRSVIGDRSWFANCAWDALAILSLLGDGRAEGPHGLVWEVRDGTVEPDGVVHLLVPAAHFWDDVGFT